MVPDIFWIIARAYGRSPSRPTADKPNPPHYPGPRDGNSHRESPTPCGTAWMAGERAERGGQRTGTARCTAPRRRATEGNYS